MIKITFSYGYDCQRITAQQSISGELTVGPLGLISYLETQLGLAAPEESFTKRLIQYHQCIKKALKTDYFFYNSFIENEFTATRTLLQWRDNLYMGGWEGNFDGDVPTRLKNFADVEQFAKGIVDFNVGQRLQRIIKALETNNIQIHEFAILDQTSLLPPLYRSLFEALKSHCEIIEAHQAFISTADEETDLHNLQTALLTPQANSKVSLQGDNSFIVLKSNSRSVSASYISHLITHTHQKYPGCSYGLLSENESEYIDSALEQLGATRNGNAENTPWRPAFQVLPLCFEILWEPLNPYSLLEFLNHPVGPIPARMREALADCVANNPGIGSEVWVKAVEHQLKDLAEINPELSERSAKAINRWIPQELCCPEQGLSTAEALERAQYLNDWLIGMQARFEGKPEHTMYTAALNQVVEFIHALKDLKDANIETLDRESIRHLIAEVRGTGTPLVDKFAESHPDLPNIQISNSPAGFETMQDIVIWWGCENYSSPKRSHWSKKELLALEKTNVHLWKTQSRLQFLAEQWLKPIFSANKQLVIVLHPNQSQHHPIMDNIEGVCKNWPIYHCESNLLNQSSIELLKKVPAKKLFDKVDQQSLPLAARWWKLPKDIELPKRERESFSSLDQFINSPYQWVLNYKARLEASRVSEVSDGNLLKGSLAHKLFEDYFNEHEAYHSTPAKLKKWCNERLTQLLKNEGAVLLMPGRQSEALDFKVQVSFALEKLIKHLKEAEIVKVTMEEKQDGLFPGGKLTGYIDLLAENKNGKEAVIDIKWGGFKYRRSTLSEDRYLQLATYAAMRKEKTGKWPALGYFIISDARMICNDEFYFPQAEFAPAESEENVAEFWQRFIHTWKWRREQIEEGLIEVTTSNTELTDDSIPPEEGMVIPESSDTYNDFAVLTGWRE